MGLEEGDDFVSFLKAQLQLDPSRRPTAAELLSLPFLASAATPTNSSQEQKWPVEGDSMEYEEVGGGGGGGGSKAQALVSQAEASDVPQQKKESFGDAWSGGRFQRRHAHSPSISCLQFDSSKIVTGHHDGRVRVWDREGLACTYTLGIQAPGKSGPVTSLQFNETHLITGSSNGKVGGGC